MKSLSLYVDKWFITVAINIDGNVRPLSLPNSEDRIWLYFHEDIANSRIEYGKAFENLYRDKLPHYFGDIFKLIEEGDHSFTRYEGRREEMREIFNVSDIFNHLHHAVGEEGSVDTYISFSSDIPDVARLRFIEELEEANFKVIESVARISHLALEECKKRNIFTESGTYLVLVATNDNFHFALYDNKGNIFLRKNEGTLMGLGLDVRRRALVETIVDNINKTTKLLTTREEFDSECVRQDRFATAWLEKIAKSRHNMPVAFDGITFAVAPNNPMLVQVFPNTLDNRTTGIVDEMVRKIADFVNVNEVKFHEIAGIVFIGNTFTNQTFTQAIKNRFIVDDDKIVVYREEELPKVVNIYSQIDCDQFQGARKSFINDAKTQETLIRQAKEEEAKRRKAQEDARRQQELIDSQKKADREYNNAVENIERYESEHNYEEMIDWAEIALKIHPDDDFAQEKAALARQLLAELRANAKQFNMLLQRAKTAFEEGRWSDAISQSEMALELRPDSEEAARVKTEARRQMEIKEKVKDLLNRADMFFAQKLFEEALGQVSKILSLDPNNADAREIKQKISEVHSKHQEKINSLVSQLNDAESRNEFGAAVRTCDILIEEDSSNLRQWTAKKARLISKQKEIAEAKRRLAEIKSNIRNARSINDWQTVLNYAQLALAEIEDPEIAGWKSEAEQELEKSGNEKIQNEFLEAAANEDWAKVMSLYDSHESLKLKSSNSTWYRKAKLCLKSQATKSEGKTVHSKSDDAEPPITTRAKDKSSRLTHTGSPNKPSAEEPIVYSDKKSNASTQTRAEDKPVRETDNKKTSTRKINIINKPKR